MTDFSMLAVSLLLVLSFAAGWVAGRVGTVDAIEPRGRGR